MQSTIVRASPPVNSENIFILTHCDVQSPNESNYMAATSPVV